MKRSCRSASNSNNINSSSQSTMRYKAMASFLALLALYSMQGHIVEGFQPIHQQSHVASAIRLSPVSISTYSRPSHTATSYSNHADPPFSSENKRLSLGSRLRNIALKEEKVRTGGGVHNPSKPAFVEEVVTLQDFKKVVADEKDRLVVVRFYAKWCRACKAMEPYFYRLAHSHPGIKFVEVPVLESNANLHQGLGVPSLPFGHIYSPSAGLVEELKMSKKHFKSFQKVLESYAAGECDTTAEEDSQEESR